MNMVVLTAAFSSLNAGLYSTGRILRSMGEAGSAPGFTTRMSRTGVPYAGILLTGALTLFGVALNATNPGEAFEIVLNMAALGIIAAWGTIVLCQIKLHRMANAGLMERPSFRMPLSPWSGYADAAVPAERAGADAIRLPDRHLYDRHAGDHHPGIDRRLVPGSPSRDGHSRRARSAARRNCRWSPADRLIRRTDPHNTGS